MTENHPHEASHSAGPVADGTGRIPHVGHAYTDDSSHGNEHHGLAKYIYVFLALCVLTGASFFTYSSLWPFHKTPQVGWAFMMAVSCTKAMLVILFFMHVKYEANWKYVLTIPCACMSVFLLLALVPDVGLRRLHYSSERLLYAADPADTEQEEEGLDDDQHTPAAAGAGRGGPVHGK